jgi:hypothetical protein
MDHTACAPVGQAKIARPIIKTLRAAISHRSLRGFAFFVGQVSNLPYF